MSETPILDSCVSELISEHERAIKQRDEYIRSGVSTAAHGGSHDTMFRHIVSRYINERQLSTAIATEREACARVCEEHSNCFRSAEDQYKVLNAIRARREGK